MLNINNYIELIEAKISRLDLPQGEYNSLYAPIRYALEPGGKRIRPVLVLMAAGAFGANPAIALDPAVGLEVYHNHTLLHDDVMDNSDTRRGRPSVGAKYGTNAAILSGDAMMSVAARLMMNVEPSVMPSVMQTFIDMTLNVDEGQSLDMDFEERDDVSVDNYIRMITGKTGALLGACCKIGAIIANSSPEDADKMYEFGINLGIAFQIQDDWLDTFGDPATFGKPIGGDINNNKKTYLLLKAFEEISNQSKLKNLINMAPGKDKVNAITDLYRELGLFDSVKRAVSDYSSRAVDYIMSANMSAEGKKMFVEMVDSLIHRAK